jgi:hypothetical protein
MSREQGVPAAREVTALQVARVGRVKPGPDPSLPWRSAWAPAPCCAAGAAPGLRPAFAAHFNATYGWVRQLRDLEFFAAALERCRAAGPANAISLTPCTPCARPYGTPHQKLQQMRRLLAQPPVVPLGTRRFGGRNDRRGGECPHAVVADRQSRALPGGACIQPAL